MNWGYPIAWLSVTTDAPALVVWPFFFGTVWYVPFSPFYISR